MTESGRVRAAVDISWLVLKESVLSFGANRGLQAAAMLAFYGFLSLMPLLLVVIYLLGFVMSSSEAVLGAVRGTIEALFPTFNEAILTDLMALSKSKVWGVVSFVFLIWSMTPFAGAVRASILDIFKEERRLHFLKAKLLDAAAVLMVLSLFVILSAARVYLSLRAESGLLPLSILASVINLLLPFAVSVVVLGLFYLVFAPVRVPPVPLLAGAATTTVLLAVMRPLFGLMLAYNPDYGYAFGSLKTIFLLLIWVYYTFAALLFGAEVMANVRRREALVLRNFIRAPTGGKAVSTRLLARFARTLGAGETLFREGDAGREMFFVAQGSVNLTKGGRLLKTAGAGEYFGEMSMLIDAPRTADATAAATPTRLITVSQDNFDTLLRENPRLVQNLLREMAVRLRTTSEALRNA